MALGSSVNVMITGIPVRFESDLDACLDAALAIHGPALTSSGPPEVHVRVMRHADPMIDVRAPGVRWSYPAPGRAMVEAPGLNAIVDLLDGLAMVHVDEAFARNLPQFRRTVLEGIVASLLAGRDRFPIHASAVRCGDAAVLFSGQSGVGKSTLAYVAHRAGIDVLADDAVRVQLCGGLRLWGDGARPRVHLLERARDDFPELAERTGERLSASGVLKLSIDVPFVRDGAVSCARFGRVCLVTRGSGPVAVEAVCADELRDALMHPTQRVSDMFHDRRPAVVDAITRCGGWRMSLSSDPRDAVPHIRTMLDRVQATQS